jgi:copper homeostasis protein
LNAALALGGLTPSLGTVLEVRQAMSLPVMVMIRPRPSGFCYSAADFHVMRRDIDLMLAHGADGIVLGVLQENVQVDVARCGQLLRQVGDRPVVFHRAFDVTPDPFVALEQLIDLGVRRVMTSGQEASALQGAATIAELIRRAADRIEILPAAGINRSTVKEVIARTGCDQIHASLRGRRRDRSTATRARISFGNAGSADEEHFDATDPAAVAEMRALLR